MKRQLISLFIVFAIFVPTNAFAAIGLPSQPKGQGVQPGGGNAVNDLGTVVNNTITLFFTIGGIGFVIMILWGAVDWILSGGDKEKLAGARKRITTAIIGLVLLSLTFIIMLVLGQILGISSLYTGKFNIPGLLQKN